MSQARKFLLVALAGVLVSLAPVSTAGALAGGQTIAFGEDPPSGLAQYTAVGVTFGSGPFGIVEGLSLGDPGGWGLEGTNDSYFMGFNGPYAADASLDESVSGVSLDVSRSGGSSDGDITLEALSGSTVVDTATVTLGNINSWSALAVSGPMDGFRITGSGTGFHPFGVDNIVIAAAPNTAPVAAAGPTQTVQLSGGTAAVTLDGSASTDANSDPLTYSWTGDFTGASATGVAPLVTFTSAGTHTVTLVVDDGQATDSNTVDIVVSAADTPVEAPAAPAATAAASVTPSYAG